MMDELTETDRIERDLARTRQRMDGRLDELQDHLNPAQMLNDAFALFRGKDGAEFTNNLVGRVRANPLPVALTGIGIAWLISANHRPNAEPVQAQASDNDLEARIRRAEADVERFDHDDEDSYASRLDDARGKVVGIARDASETAGIYAARVKDAVASAAHAARTKSHDLSNAASDGLGTLADFAAKQSNSIQEGTQHVASSARDMLSSVTNNPLALGALAALVGVVAGALLPTSDEEEAALGAVADKVRTAGKDLAQDVVDHGGRIATETLTAVKDSAEAHGLTTDKPIGEILSDAKSGDLLGDIKEVAQETLQAGKDSARSHIGNL